MHAGVATTMGEDSKINIDKEETLVIENIGYFQIPGTGEIYTRLRMHIKHFAPRTPGYHLFILPCFRGLRVHSSTFSRESRTTSLVDEGSRGKVSSGDKSS